MLFIKSKKFLQSLCLFWVEVYIEFVFVAILFHCIILYVYLWFLGKVGPDFSQNGHTGSFSLAEGKLLRLPLTPHIRHIYRLEGKKSGLGSSVIRDGRFFIF